MTETGALVAYDRHTALVVVDMQNDFAHPDGNLYVADGEATVPVANQQVALARDAGALVVYTQDWHPESTPHFEKDGGTWPVHCVQETWGADFYADLDVDGTVVRKGIDGEDGYSGFTVQQPRGGEKTPTALHDLLRENGIRSLVVVGLAQDVCVKETVLDARRLDYPVRVLVDGTRPVNLHEGDGEAAWQQMAEAGVELLDDETLLAEHETQYRGNPSTRELQQQRAAGAERMGDW